MNIMYLTDNNYAPFAGVSMLSLFKNNRSIDKFTVFVIDDGISVQNKQKMQKTAEVYGHEVVFLDLSTGVETLKANGAPTYRGSYTTYLKLFAFGLLPSDVHRIFFIDSDSVVVDDLGELENYDMQGSIIAAVRDGICHPYKMALGFDEDDSWFNMGVMLVDVDLWKSSNAENLIVEQLKKRTGYIAVDQDLLNITQHGKIATLHPRYNATAHHYVYSDRAFYRAFPQGGFYADSTVFEEARDRPVIRHFERFIGDSAWSKNSIHPFAPYFDQYLSISEWADYEKKEKPLSAIHQIERYLYLFLPADIFVFIFSAAFKHYLLSTNKKLLKNSAINNIE